MWSEQEPDCDKPGWPAGSAQHRAALLRGCKAKPWASPPVKCLHGSREVRCGFSPLVWGRKGRAPSCSRRAGLSAQLCHKAKEEEERRCYGDPPAPGRSLLRVIAHLSSKSYYYPHFPGDKTKALWQEAICHHWQKWGHPGAPGPPVGTGYSTCFSGHLSLAESYLNFELL